MSGSTIALQEVPRCVPPVRMRTLAHCLAAAILAISLVTPTCCLTGAHAHGAGALGPICLSRLSAL